MQKIRMIAKVGCRESAFVGVFTAWHLKIGGITGRVWNNDDGTVEILAQADSSAIMAKFIQEIRKGPTPFSKVSYLDVKLSNFPPYPDFKIAN